MDHVSGGAAAGTFWGHALPGSLFLLWALFWIVQAFLRRGAHPSERSLEAGPVLPYAKVVGASLCVWIEIPGQGWYPQDVMMNWQHVTMYAVFGLSGAVDLLARKGLFSSASTYAAYSAAMANAGFLFWGHSAHGGVEGLTHSILALAFFAVAAVGLMEVLRRGEGLRWARIASQLVLGSWFIVAAWILHRSGWDLGDRVRVGWTYTAFSWTAIVGGVVASGAMLLSRTLGSGSSSQRGS